MEREQRRIRPGRHRGPRPPVRKTRCRPLPPSRVERDVPFHPAGFPSGPHAGSRCLVLKKDSFLPPVYKRSEQ
ncbi:hypothetical protein DPEC_G00058960 [Dallia pectoralis]|uniref:Uncharacterized protein n=1 Tax=Dallia pectoralis TaxID=75939 RepID=A0ACC2H6C4_DALPE|nr:hypothetical protein DPEC_G00058960 [Dallia pectoralis]